MPNKNLTDFEVMDIMASEDKDIRMSAQIVDFNSTPKKSTITMEMDYNTAQMLMTAIATDSLKHYVALYVINKEQFDEIKARPNAKEDEKIDG